jgi:hypothetical protein
MHTILGEHHAIRAAGTAILEVLVSPPSPALRCSHLSKIPSGTGAQVEAFVDR